MLTLLVLFVIIPITSWFATKTITKGKVKRLFTYIAMMWTLEIAAVLTYLVVT